MKPVLFVPIIAALLATSCLAQPHVEPIQGPDGKAYVAHCDTQRLSIAHCYNQAAKQCPMGYTLLGKTEFTSDLRITRNIEFACKTAQP